MTYKELLEQACATHETILLECNVEDADTVITVLKKTHNQHQMKGVLRCTPTAFGVSISILEHMS